MEHLTRMAPKCLTSYVQIGLGGSELELTKNIPQEGAFCGNAVKCGFWAKEWTEWALCLLERGITLAALTCSPLQNQAERSVAGMVAD